MKLSEGKISGLSALLDFYSDRATAHASYFIAFIFGLFTILGIAQDNNNIERWLLFLLSWIVWYSGLYCLLNFGFYANLAERTKEAIRKDEIVKEDHSIMEIDDKNLKELFLDWRWNIIRDYLFLRLMHRCTEFKDCDREQTMERSVVIGKFAKADFLYLVYWSIFALASRTVFKTSFVFQIQSIEFWNTIGLVGFLLLLVLDSIKIPKGMREYVRQKRRRRR